jgi:hypothetical protein
MAIKYDAIVIGGGHNAHCQLFFNMDDNYFLTLSRSPFSS